MSVSVPPCYAVLMPLAPWEPPAHLQEALHSLEWQELPPAQVVVSCDGEPPADLACVLQRSQLPLECVIGPGHEGVGPVLARGLLACRHDLVVRADADDFSLPERCSIQVAWMQRHLNVQALSSWIEEFTAENQHGLCRWVPCDQAEVVRCAKRRNPLNHPAVILRRQAVLAVGNYRSKPGFEDYDLWLRLLNHWGSSCLANLPRPLVRARVGRAHLVRRHGWRYARAEGLFFISAAGEDLISWPDALLALALRIPLRLLPANLLAQVMRLFTRSSWA
jgi:hypothetical protein